MTTKYRFSLRRQKKIKATFGDEFLEWLLASLKKHFETHDLIEELDYPGEPCKIIHVENTQPHTDSTFELYIIKKTYNVYNLAYKSCMG